jgi:4-amino-4-deoxy-L-arabinose transferase-like glycosyltransferase
MPALLSSRERFAWLVGFALIAALIIATRFESHDADSVRYATLSSVLSTLPVVRWIAPEWWGLTGDNPLTGYFQEHPAGLFFVPAFLGRIGVPPDQAPYIFGVGVALCALLLLGQLIGRVTTRDEGRAALVLLQIMPVAFVFRVRDNHEYPMLLCLLATLIGLSRVSRSWAWSGAVVFGIAGALLIKGVFVAQILLGAALWILVNPTKGSRPRQIAACAAAVIVSAGVAWAYDLWYVNVTGESFWRAYWGRQIGTLEVTTPFGRARDFAEHLFFYVALLIYHPAPWTLALAWAAFGRRAAAALTTLERDALRFAMLFSAASVIVLSFASRFAERYAFSSTYVLAAAGVVAAWRLWPVVPRAVARLDRAVPALPVVVWVVLVGSRLLLGQWLPRIQ